MIVCVSIAILSLAVFYDDSLSKLFLIKESLSFQERENHELRHRVDELDAKINGLQHDPRSLERAARNELGMARPNDLIFVFEEGAKK